MATVKLTWQDIDTGETTIESRVVTTGDDIAAFRFLDTPDRVQRLVGIGERQVITGPPVEDRDSGNLLRPASARSTGAASSSALPNITA